MWEREWLEGKITKEEAKTRASDGENINALLESTERTAEFEVEDRLGKDIAWKMLEDKIAASTKSKVILMPRRYWITGVAASFILAIGALFLFQNPLTELNKSTVGTQVAQSQTVALPGGSMVYLNAQSEISYSEADWQHERTVRLEGEGFFEVVKGNKFTVVTDYGNVEVLGTSFNVRARNGKLEVSCKTGKVRVTAPSKASSQTITPGQKVIARGEIVQAAVTIDAEQIGSWRQGDFDFESTPLTEVLEEFGRQFDIELEYDNNDPEIINRVYNGYFDNHDMIEAIQLICNPMGLEYEVKENSIHILGHQ